MAFRLIYQLFPDIYNQAGAATGDDVSDMHVVSAWTVLSRQRYLRQEKCRSIGLSTDPLEPSECGIAWKGFYPLKENILRSFQQADPHFIKSSLPRSKQLVIRSAVGQTTNGRCHALLCVHLHHCRGRTPEHRVLCAFFRKGGVIRGGCQAVTSSDP